MISTYLYDENLGYDGTQLRSHFALETFEIYGNSLVAFIGPCKVDLGNMVDIEDVLNEEGISSDKMIHFILEIFNSDLEKSVLFQRMLVTEIYKAIVLNINNDAKLIGDDIFCFEKKLSVSIATVSPVSSMCHTGINITVKGAPIEVSSLEEFKIDPVKFAEFVLDNFKKEYLGIQKAISKVRAVK